MHPASDGRVQILVNRICEPHRERKTVHDGLDDMGILLKSVSVWVRHHAAHSDRLFRHAVANDCKNPVRSGGVGGRLASELQFFSNRKVRTIVSR